MQSAFDVEEAQESIIGGLNILRYLLAVPPKLDSNLDLSEHIVTKDLMLTLDSLEARLRRRMDEVWAEKCLLEGGDVCSKESQSRLAQVWVAFTHLQFLLDVHQRTCDLARCYTNRTLTCFPDI